MNELWLAQAFGDGPSPFGPMGVMVAIFAFFYFLVIRPQQKREKDKEAMRSGLKKNDEVVTAGGLHGRVVDLKGNIMFLEIAPNVRVRMERASVEAVPSRSGKSEEQGTTKE
jgi:preprotein translocase subunit YajC